MISHNTQLPQSISFGGSYFSPALIARRSSSLFIPASSSPRERKAPGGRIITSTAGKSAPNSDIPSKLPLPSTSRTAPRTASPNVKPIPIPKPSTNECQTLFRLAKASALPRMTQFTTINGMNRPRLLWSSKKKPCITRSTMVTNDAMITMYAGMRTFFGIKFLNRETRILLHNSTKVLASPMPIPFSTDVVTASVGQSPSNNRKIGFSFQIPRVNI